MKGLVDSIIPDTIMNSQRNCLSKRNLNPCQVSRRMHGDITGFLSSLHRVTQFGTSSNSTSSGGRTAVFLRVERASWTLLVKFRRRTNSKTKKDLSPFTAGIVSASEGCLLENEKGIFWVFSFVMHVHDLFIKYIPPSIPCMHTLIMHTSECGKHKEVRDERDQ